MANSIVINSVDQTGKKNAKTITDINPNATGDKLKEFAEGLNALTTNTYVSTNRISKDKLSATSGTFPVPGSSTAPEPSSDLPAPKFYTGTWNSRGSEITGTTQWEAFLETHIYTDTDGAPYLISAPKYTAISAAKFTPSESGYTGWAIYNYGGSPDGGGYLGELVIGFEATENFAAATLTFNIYE